MYRHDPNVFVAGDLLWYPVEGEPRISTAPDVLVAFGRPKGHRGSYKQWEEGGIAPQVVFEVLSPSNDWIEMRRKLDFFDQYGVDEYYLFDPYQIDLKGWRREGSAFRRVFDILAAPSPRLGIRFELNKDLIIYGADGRPFATYNELLDQRQQEEKQARADRQRADTEHRRAERFLALLREKGIPVDEPPPG